MVFSTVHFLFLFFPIVLTVYFALPKIARNAWLLLASLFFYAWGEGFFTLIMIFSIVVNHYLGVWIDKNHEKLTPKKVLVIGLVVNLSLLGFYKYGNFIVKNINHLLTALNAGAIPSPKIHLPIGISFFTFQSMSYIMDVYRREVPAQQKFTNTALYISSFPQLVAGPIVRYHDVASQLMHREVTREKFALGLKRFIVGLGKKVLIANTCAVTVDKIFGNPLYGIDGVPTNELTFALAWIGILFYAIQLYFDFSGYSDMAIGMGHMFGFTFLENFNYPFISLSIRDHWKRWHISLTNWFRDYVYIPLGGNRKGVFRTYFNLVIIFVLAGFWHGADWHYLLWGLYNGLFLALERRVINVDKYFRFVPIKWTYTMVVILIGYVFFRANTIEQAFPYVGAMFGFAQGTGAGHHPMFYVQNETIIAFIAGVIGSGPTLPYLNEVITTALGRYNNRFARIMRPVFPIIKMVLLLLVLILSIITLSSGTHNPFIYYIF